MEALRSCSIPRRAGMKRSSLVRRKCTKASSRKARMMGTSQIKAVAKATITRSRKESKSQVTNIRRY